MDERKVRIGRARRKTERKGVLRDILRDAARGTRRYLRAWTAGRGGE